LAAELLRERPEDPALLMTFSDAALLLDNVYGEGGMEGALKRLDRVLPAESFDLATRKYLVTSSWLDAGRPDLARVEIERAVEAAPANAGLRLMACQLALALEDWNALLKHAEHLRQLAPDTPDPLWYKAVALEHSGKVEQAKTLYQDLAAKYADLPLGYVGMSRLLENARDYRGALNWIRQWMDRAPLEPGLAQTLVRLLALKGEGQEAVKWAERALDSPESPGHGPPNTGRASAQAGTPAASAKSTEKGETSDVSRPLAVTLGAAAGFLDASDYDRAETWAMRGLALAKELPEAQRRDGITGARMTLGQVFWARSRRAKDAAMRRAMADQAIAAYRSVLETSSSNEVAANNLAILLNERGDIEAALFVADRLCRGDLSDKRVTGDRLPLEILDTVGTIYRSAGRFDEAIVLFQEATQRYAKEPQVRLHLGRAHAGRRQYAAAAEQLTLAVTGVLQNGDGQGLLHQKK
jgi:tetratricopeptide (TPR) repeat protein